MAVWERERIRNYFILARLAGLRMELPPVVVTLEPVRVLLLPTVMRCCALVVILHLVAVMDQRLSTVQLLQVRGALVQ